MGRSLALWQDSAGVARACLEHPFVQGLARGTLPRDRFLFYVEQDAFFLDSFARAYALAFAKAPDMDTMAKIRALFDGVYAELELHRDYAHKWGAHAWTPSLPEPHWRTPTSSCKSPGARRSATSSRL